MKPLHYDPASSQPAGGWFIDETRMAISYRGHGHADPVLRAAIELAAGLPRDSTIRRDLLGSGPASACIRCHPGADTSGSVLWRPAPGADNPAARFTKFSHQPHMNLPVLADCSHCHAVAADGQQTTELFQMTSISLTDRHSSQPPHDFAPVEREVCATCLTAKVAGDACIQCHRYHSGPPPMR